MTDKNVGSLKAMLVLTFVNTRGALITANKSSKKSAVILMNNATIR